MNNWLLGLIFIAGCFVAGPVDAKSCQGQEAGEWVVFHVRNAVSGETRSICFAKNEFDEFDILKSQGSREKLVRMISQAADDAIRERKIRNMLRDGIGRKGESIGPLWVRVGSCSGTTADPDIC